MKFFLIVMLSGFLYSCSTQKRIPMNIIIERQIEAVMDSISRNDTIPTVVVNNVTVIVPEQKKKGLSDQNTQLLITGFFTSLSGFFAIMFVDQSNQ